MIIFKIFLLIIIFQNSLLFSNAFKFFLIILFLMYHIKDFLGVPVFRTRGIKELATKRTLDQLRNLESAIIHVNADYQVEMYLDPECHIESPFNIITEGTYECHSCKKGPCQEDFTQTNPLFHPQARFYGTGYLDQEGEFVYNLDFGTVLPLHKIPESRLFFPKSVTLVKLGTEDLFLTDYSLK